CRDGRARRDRRGRLGGDQSQPGEKGMGHAKAWCALDGAAQQGRRVATETVEAGERLIKEARGLRSRAGKGVALLVGDHRMLLALRVSEAAVWLAPGRWPMRRTPTFFAG